MVAQHRLQPEAQEGGLVGARQQVVDDAVGQPVDPLLGDSVRNQDNREAAAGRLGARAGQQLAEAPWGSMPGRSASMQGQGGRGRGGERGQGRLGGEHDLDRGAVGGQQGLDGGQQGGFSAMRAGSERGVGGASLNNLDRGCIGDG